MPDLRTALAGPILSARVVSVLHIVPDVSTHLQPAQQAMSVPMPHLEGLPRFVVITYKTEIHIAPTAVV